MNERWKATSATAMLITAITIFLWNFSLPSFFIGELTFDYIEKHRLELAKMVDESKCNPEHIRSGIEVIGKSAGLNEEAMAQLGLGTASSVGSTDCFLSVHAGYDSIYLYNPTKNCWRFGRWMLTSLPGC